MAALQEAPGGQATDVTPCAKGATVPSAAEDPLWVSLSETGRATMRVSATRPCLEESITHKAHLVKLPAQEDMIMAL